MKCQLLGYQTKEGVNQETQKPYKMVRLFLVRTPSFSESGVTGNVCFQTNVFNESIDKLPELIVNGHYQVECSQYQGRYRLDNISLLK